MTNDSHTWNELTCTQCGASWKHLHTCPNCGHRRFPESAYTPEGGLIDHGGTTQQMTIQANTRRKSTTP